MVIYYNLLQNFDDIFFNFEFYFYFISKNSFVDVVALLNQQKLATRINII
jgi:hypothetical protein